MRRAVFAALLPAAGLLLLTAAATFERSAAAGNGAIARHEAGEQAAVAADVLLLADRDFATAVAEGGSQAWATWFAEDGAMIQPGAGEIRGRAAIREFMAVLDDPSVSLTWEPDRADIAASGDLGWTTGHYVSEGRGPDGAPQRSEGLYVSIWRRQADGSWKVVMDLGNPLAPPRQ